MEIKHLSKSCEDNILFPATIEPDLDLLLQIRDPLDL